MLSKEERRGAANVPAPGDVLSKHVTWGRDAFELTDAERLAIIAQMLADAAQQNAVTIAVPVVQMRAIYDGLQRLVRLGQATAEEWLAMPANEAALRRQVFELAESALLFAGNSVRRSQCLAATTASAATEK